MLFVEEFYIENILCLNWGKIVIIYMIFENSKEWGLKIFCGVIEVVGWDYIIFSDLKLGICYLFLIIYFDYIIFDEEIVYMYLYFMLFYLLR